MIFLVAVALAFVGGYWYGRLKNKSYLRDKRVALARKIQLIASRNEMKGYRRKRRRPMLSVWKKCILGLLFHLSPTLTKYANFRPETLVGWHRRYVRSWCWLISRSGKCRSVGRPKIDPAVDMVVSFKMVRILSKKNL